MVKKPALPRRVPARVVASGVKVAPVVEMWTST